MIHWSEIAGKAREELDFRWLESDGPKIAKVQERGFGLKLIEKQPCIPDDLPLANLDWRALLPLAGKGNAALARYEGMLQTLPNPAVLLSPITVNEAVLSSRIEGTQATLDEVLEFDAGLESADRRSPRRRRQCVSARVDREQHCRTTRGRRGAAPPSSFVKRTLSRAGADWAAITAPCARDPLLITVDKAARLRPAEDRHD